MSRRESRRIEVIGLSGIGEVRSGDDLVALALDACALEGLSVLEGDVFVFTQKIVSKSEGRTVELGSVEPSVLARTFAEAHGRDPRLIEVVLRESRRVVRMDRGVLITETHHGLVCANSGVDASNLDAEGAVCLLPEDPDRSAAELRRGLEQQTGRRLAVLLTDTFGRPWREGLTNVAIGVSGMDPLDDQRGLRDPLGRVLQMSVIAVADELAAAAELVMGKLERVPLAIVRGYVYPASAGGTASLLREPERDLFR
jgi:coenzyme F420-0:L-glutamate ligase / coenzyme F420-1:gamma-L-glutamate ligase